MGERGWTKGGGPSQKGSPRPGYPPPADLKDRSWTWDGGGATLGWGQEAGESPGREHRGWEGAAGLGGGGGGANLAVQPEEGQHDEEEAGPQLGQGHHGHGLGKTMKPGREACRAHTASGRPVRTRVCTCVSACVCWLSPVCYSREHPFPPVRSPLPLPSPWFWGPALCQAHRPSTESFL